jgi:hypothetical protein
MQGYIRADGHSVKPGTSNQLIPVYGMPPDRFGDVAQVPEINVLFPEQVGQVDSVQAQVDKQVRGL